MGNMVVVEKSTWNNVFFCIQRMLSIISNKPLSIEEVATMNYISKIVSEELEKKRENKID